MTNVRFKPILFSLLIQYTPVCIQVYNFKPFHNISARALWSRLFTSSRCSVRFPYRALPTYIRWSSDHSFAYEPLPLVWKDWFDGGTRCLYQHLILTSERKARLFLLSLTSNQSLGNLVRTIRIVNRSELTPSDMVDIYLSIIKLCPAIIKIRWQTEDDLPLQALNSDLLYFHF
jgi:hypothetical protein